MNFVSHPLVAREGGQNQLFSDLVKYLQHLRGRLWQEVGEHVLFVRQICKLHDKAGLLTK